MFVNVLVCPVVSQLMHLVSDLMEAVIVCCTVARYQLSLEWKHEKREITATRLECNKHGSLCEQCKLNALLSGSVRIYEFLLVVVCIGNSDC